MNKMHFSFHLIRQIKIINFCMNAFIRYHNMVSFC